MGWLGTHRSTRGASEEWPQPHSQDPTLESQVSLLLQKLVPSCMRKAERGVEARVYHEKFHLIGSTCSTAFLGWTLLHLVPTSAVTITVPLGLFVPFPHPYPCLQMETQPHGRFYGGHVG